MAKKYILDENNNKIEVTDEVGNTTVEEVKCCVTGTPFKVAYVSQAKYNELETAGLLQPNTTYEITDDTTLEELEATNVALQIRQNEQATQLLNLDIDVRGINRHLYEHNIFCKGTTQDDKYNFILRIMIYTNDITPLGLEELYVYFNELVLTGHINTPRRIPASGYVEIKDTGDRYPVYFFRVRKSDDGNDYELNINSVANANIEIPQVFIFNNVNLNNQALRDEVRKIY